MSQAIREWLALLLFGLCIRMGALTYYSIPHVELDLLDQKAVFNFFNNQKPAYVFLAAAKVGGIQANNTYRGQFLYENLMIQNNVIHAAHESGV